MYYIYTTDNQLITSINEPYFVKLHDNKKTLTLATKRDAQGIVINSIVYTLLGHSLLPNSDTLVKLYSYDAGMAIMAQEEILSDILISLVSTEEEIQTLKTKENHISTYEHFNYLYKQGRVFEDGLFKAAALGLLTSQQVDQIINPLEDEISSIEENEE